MKSEIKKLEKSQVEIKIEVTPSEYQPMLEKAAARIADNIKIEGFRPGKAPYEIVKARVGEAKIMEEALEEILSHTYYEAVVKNEIVSMGQPKIEIEKMAPGNDLVYKATVAVLPKVEIGDYKKIELKKEKIEVKDEQVENVIKEIQRMRAKETAVERAAKQGDRLEIDFDIFLDKVPIENGAHKKYPITIGEGRFIPGFEDQLIGMGKGQVKEFELKFPDDYYEKKMAGKNAEFRVTCQNIFEVELPKLDDEFSQNVSNGQIKTIDELKGKIRENIEQEQKLKSEQKLEIEMLEKILAISKFDDLPEMMIENESHKMVHELEHDIENRGLKFDEYLKSINKSHDDLEKDFRPEAEKRIKIAIITREIYQSQKMEVTEEEIQKEIELILKSYPTNPEVRNQIESESYKDYLRNMLGNRKVMEYLKGAIIK